jgi:hypothetical protein
MERVITNDIEQHSVRVVRTWRMNKEKNTIVFTIPRMLAKKYQLDSPTNMLVIPTSDGILIKKLETEDIK